MTLVVEARVKASFSLCEISSGAPAASGWASRATSESLMPAFCSAVHTSVASGARTAGALAGGVGAMVAAPAVDGAMERSPAAGVGACASAGAAASSQANAALAPAGHAENDRRLLMNQ